MPLLSLKVNEREGRCALPALALNEHINKVDGGLFLPWIDIRI